MEAIPPRLVLYDGACGLCDRIVQWALKHDPEGKLRFAPLQGETARAILERHPEVPEDLDSVMFVEQAAGIQKVYWRSRAVFEIARYLEARWRWLAILRWIPAFISDLGYRFVARIRMRIWGSVDECRLMPSEVRDRFLP